jgi:hypothetical protein
MTGYTVEKFRKLLLYFKAAHDAYLPEYHMNNKRRRALWTYTMSADSPPSCLEKRSAFILPYLNPNPIREAHVDLFGMERKHCCLPIHCLQEILHRAQATADSVLVRTDAEL